MKKLYFLLFLLPLSLFGQSFLMSHIPLPKTYIQNLDPYECDEACLQRLIDNEMIFSFLAHANGKLENSSLDEIRMMHISILNLGSQMKSDELKIALLLPHKIIGRYASSTTNALFSYLLTRNHSFELRSYTIETQEAEEISKVLTQIQKDGFSYVIAPLTQEGADAVAQIDPQIYIYFPTINKHEVTHFSPFLYYGGIDYKAQSKLLLQYAASPLVIFHDNSKIGLDLTSFEEEAFKYREVKVQENSFFGFNAKERIEKVFDANRTVLQFSIPKRTTNLEHQLKENKSINNASFFLNTPIVKSSMIMSQLTLYDVNVTNVLSTQINYDPLLLSMTQYADRKDMIIANSITQQNNVLIEVNALLGNDIIYDWINYTTTIGADFFFHQITNEQREYSVEIQENQMLYDIELLQPSVTKFMKFEAPISEERY
jgi:hypothetical protein